MSYKELDFKNESSERICFLLEKEGSKDRIELQKALGISEADVVDALAELDDYKLIEKDGKYFYKLKEKF
ncbi:MAG: hypothetical protein HeimC3_32180 [Candidatus Heimdallarchaeota archaeon LC_3]|nr:MAG: hypothetical protein HeimC3_32180 [Candidatus Heimdallarchaeota archaeon LC_3]